MECGLYENKKALILGMGISGRSAARFLTAKGANVCGVDKNALQLSTHPDIVSLKNFCLVDESDCPPLRNFNLAVLSPGINSEHPLVRQAMQEGVEVVGEIMLGCRYAWQKILGITGTNGKTTVTLLVTHALNAAGLPAKALGNVGVPFSQELLSAQPDDIFVLELSSYQLEQLEGAFLDQGVLLNITPDHLDRYKSMDDYAQAKLRIASCMKPSRKLWIEEKSYGNYTASVPSSNRYGYHSGCALYTDLHHLYFEGRSFVLPPGLQGKKSHALENFLAAFALCQSQGVTYAQFAASYASFKMPSHRIEFVLEKEGVRYYDDSKGTNIDAVLRAVESIEGKLILIAGGVDKGSSYTTWIEPFKNKVKCICAIGQAAGKIESQLAHAIPVTSFATLEEAVSGAARLALKGEAVLLSPGCASYDMFKDYAHRGDVFQQYVKRGLQ
ncbi:MAG: UDP-N-acetylmuramoyl-L-alanine--D-glutamate ligase [Parachlamydia sp.]|jgi:UDP-N-acetylmuramoylalanine--D-glutamate ligase|nr:UDP-N-acetylmuramoyl-L-alanine--D-glutamate ligase [Parachlamydia sp.]